MRIPKELKKINAFREVNLPKNSEIFARLQGNMINPSANNYSGDESIPLTLNKVEKLGRAEKLNQKQLKIEAVEASKEQGV